MQLSGSTFFAKNAIIREEEDSIYYIISETPPDKINIVGSFENDKTAGTPVFSMEQVIIDYIWTVSNGDKLRVKNTGALVSPEYRNYIVVIKLRIIN